MCGVKFARQTHRMNNAIIVKLNGQRWQVVQCRSAIREFSDVTLANRFNRKEALESERPTIEFKENSSVTEVQLKCSPKADSFRGLRLDQKSARPICVWSLNQIEILAI